MLLVFLSPNFTVCSASSRLRGGRLSKIRNALNDLERLLSKVAFIFMQLIFINEVQICYSFALRAVFEIQACQKSQINALI